jgi:hypothetical protein
MSLLTQASLVVTPNGYKEGTLYSVVPNNSNGDFTVTRATTATRVNAAGLVELVPYNLLTWSEQFNNAIWSKLALTVTANNVVAPNGTLTADTLSFVDSTSRARQSLSLRGGVYTLSVYAKTEGGTGVCRLRATIDGTYGTLLTFTPTSTWQRFEITFTALTSLTDLEIRSADAVGNFAFWGAQLVEGTQVLDYQKTETRLNIPRLDYSLGSCPNILLEPQRTNLLLNTIFSGSGAVPTSWTQPATGTSLLTTSTLGVGVQACSQSATSQRPFLFQNVTLVANTTYSYSIYVESISGGLSNENVLLVALLPVGATITYFSNGVSVSPSATAVVGRLSINIVVSVLGGNTQFRCGIGTASNSTGTLLFSRPQLEAGAYPTSYIPTSSASVTRNADVISRGNIFTNGLITASGGTWFVDLRNNIARIRDASTQGLFLASDTGLGNGFCLRTSGGPNRLEINKIISSSNTLLYVTTSDTSKIAIKWNGTTADIFVNGVKVISATAFTATNIPNIGTATNVPYNINSMALFPTPLTDTQCIALTT